MMIRGVRSTKQALQRRRQQENEELEAGGPFGGKNDKILTALLGIAENNPQKRWFVREVFEDSDATKTLAKSLPKEQFEHYQQIACHTAERKRKGKPSGVAEVPVEALSNTETKMNMWRNLFDHAADESEKKKAIPHSDTDQTNARRVSCAVDSSSSGLAKNPSSASIYRRGSSAARRLPPKHAQGLYTVSDGVIQLRNKGKPYRARDPNSSELRQTWETANVALDKMRNFVDDFEMGVRATMKDEIRANAEWFTAEETSGHQPKPGPSDDDDDDDDDAHEDEMVEISQTASGKGEKVRVVYVRNPHSAKRKAGEHEMGDAFLDAYRFQQRREALMSATLAASKFEDGDHDSVRSKRWGPMLDLFGDLEANIHRLEMAIAKTKGMREPAGNVETLKREKEEALEEGLGAEHVDIAEFSSRWLRFFSERVQLLTLYSDIEEQERLRTVDNAATQLMPEDTAFLETMVRFDNGCRPLAASAPLTSTGTFVSVKTRVNAAVSIQALFRGYRVRKWARQAAGSDRSYLFAADKRWCSLWERYHEGPIRSVQWLKSLVSNLLNAKSMHDFICNLQDSPHVAFTPFLFQHMEKCYGRGQRGIDDDTPAAQHMGDMLRSLNQHKMEDPLFKFLHRLILGDWSDSEAALGLHILSQFVQGTTSGSSRNLPTADHIPLQVDKVIDVLNGVLGERVSDDSLISISDLVLSELRTEYAEDPDLSQAPIEAFSHKDLMYSICGMYRDGRLVPAATHNPHDDDDDERKPA
eukprot:NODE_267_length_2564_cov_43.374553_g245_i0.p1 GENE.NODE_267_length_2564_cov_43.374553_g245_i0~~NODE_267_length_2564_cov_43.374553_g245_i0.p1  ORF type:complete len:784 (-),score=176.55 NODE_267_length_2564_cov_43.374553_g245_i0:211-2481(-)